MMRKVILFAAFAALAGCGSQPREKEVPAAAPDHRAARPAAMPAALNPALDTAALQSRNCADVMEFYAQAVQAGDYASAAKVWKQDLLPKDGLARQFAGYRMAKLSADGRTEEGAAGSLYCEVAVSLTDAADPRKDVARGAITLRRVNDVDGATPEQLRWQIEKSEIPGIGAPG